MMERRIANVLRCLDCGKCTSGCPVARYNHTLSPRRIVRRNSRGGSPEALWSCLTCMRCDTLCPQEVGITSLLPLRRAEVRADGDQPPFTRCGAMESVAVIQSQADLPQNRLDWLPEDVRTDPASKTLLWVGCTSGGEERPSLLLITIDTLRPDRLACDGGDPEIGTGI